jgi:hypothetical protein
MLLLSFMRYAKDETRRVAANVLFTCYSTTAPPTLHSNHEPHPPVRHIPTYCDVHVKLRQRRAPCATTR